MIDAPGIPPAAGAPFSVHFDPRGPDDTWVVVRPWLLARA